MWIGSQINKESCDYKSMLTCNSLRATEISFPPGTRLAPRLGRRQSGARQDKVFYAVRKDFINTFCLFGAH